MISGGRDADPFQTHEDAVFLKHRLNQGSHIRAGYGYSPVRMLNWGVWVHLGHMRWVASKFLTHSYFQGFLFAVY